MATRPCVFNMTAEERDKRISEVCDLMENGKATQDDFWDAVFPDLYWCEYELGKLGFRSDYKELHQIIEVVNSGSDLYTVVPGEALVYRTVTPETDVLEHDERTMLRTALRYWQSFIQS